MSYKIQNQILKYDFQKCIGRGNFGDVYRAIDLTQRNKVAIKVVSLDESTEEMKQIIQEIHFLSKLRNPFVIQYIESFLEGYNMFIVMEYCGGGSCADLLRFHKKLEEDVVSYIIKGVLSGLKYLHSEHKVHRDIKLANILLTEKGDIKLADFGVSGEITMTRLKKNTFVGTPFWMAPEVITRSRTTEESGYDEKADIWSTGITTIELVTGSPPLSEYDPLKVLFEIPKKRPPLLCGVDFSENIKDFVKYCLVKDPKKRPSSDILSHHYFITRGHDVRDKLAKLIRTKNIHYESKSGRKPRFKIEHLMKSPNNTFAPILWEFGTERNPEPKPGNQKLASGNGDLKQENDEEDHSSETGNFFKDKGGVLLYCLERVYFRGRSEFTRRTVENLTKDITRYEEQLPGLCHAIVEELERLCG